MCTPCRVIGSECRADAGRENCLIPEDAGARAVEITSREELIRPRTVNIVHARTFDEWLSRRIAFARLSLFLRVHGPCGKCEQTPCLDHDRLQTASDLESRTLSVSIGPSGQRRGDGGVLSTYLSEVTKRRLANSSRESGQRVGKGVAGAGAWPLWLSHRNAVNYSM